MGSDITIFSFITICYSLFGCVLGVMSGFWVRILRRQFVAKRCISWSSLLVDVSVVIPYHSMLPIAAFHRSVLSFNLISGSWKTRRFTIRHVDFAVFIRSFVAMVVDFVRLIVRPMIFPCVWDFMYLYFPGTIAFKVRMLWLIPFTIMSTLPRFILMLKWFPVLSKSSYFREDSIEVIHLNGYVAIV